VLQLLGLAPLIDLVGAPGLGRGEIAGSANPPGYAQPPDVELILTASPGEIGLLPGAPTRVWRFTGELVHGPASTLQTLPGSCLGPVIRVRRGQRVRIRFRNRLDEPSIVHWHGLDVPEQADGHPRLAIEPGAEYVYDFDVTNRAGTYWYHPHPHMRTGAQVYRGLAGLLLVSDSDEDALGLPAGAGELLCVLQDRRVDAGNQLVYADAGPSGMGQMMATMNGWLGDRMLVSGRVQPTLDVDRRTYRVRLLNGSNARFYKLAWHDGSPMVVIGGDGGLLERAWIRPAVTLAPGQRADVLLDVSAHAPGSEVRLQSLAFPSAHVGRVGMMMGQTPPTPQGAALTLMTLRVSSARAPAFVVPPRLSAHEAVDGASAPVRRVPLTFARMNWQLDGRVFDLADVAAAETVAAGSTHIWEFVNQTNPMGMEMAHPIHVHGRQFRVLSRAGGSANSLREGIADAGWIDTVVVLPGETVRVQVTFSKYAGLYLYHCHILEHEDMGMMRNFRIA
jgi:FtsP/CotA-like multicopper oxidase with cupredoxin domain